ncbi:winged helix-turn-helix domain-containing protein [Citrobacter amalonaticus]|uniref:transcriptional regulator n=1 Tax=Citrobacter amalonaticus TaxID=35703 RepID=UPI0019073E71|nr:winged helix-turn-helix domain-containing protein [Citrobacter amalonaticus]MBJ9260453.1 winged helix-turn-helix domain-containing protein [Citrobacter amalonaticus]
MSIVVNKWRMDPSLSALIHCETGETRRLGEYHYLLLETLAKNADTVLSRSYLMTEVWKNRVVGSNSLPTAIHALRVAIDDDGKQQEIIKTVPKKGYLFNKSYLSTIDFADEAPPPEESAERCEENLALDDKSLFVDQLHEKKEPAPVITLTDKEAFTSSEERPAMAGSRSRLRVVALIASLVIIALLFIAFISYRHNAQTAPPVTNVPKIIKEKYPLADRIEINHILTTPVNNTQSIPLPTHIESGIIKVNELLLTHNATMRVFYRTSFKKFSLTLIVKNQCGNSWQLILSFENWQSKENEMNNVFYQEVEKMLNDMPKCA